MFFFRKKIVGPQNKKIIFLLCGWPGKIWHYLLTAKLLEFHGYQSIIYEFDNNILSSSITGTVNNTVSVKNDIIKEVNRFKHLGYTDFAVFGTSYGTIIAFMVANNEPNISRLIVNLSGADLAETVWTWNKGKESLVKNGIIHQGISLNKLKEKWSFLSPLNNIKNMRDRKILFYLSQKDNVIPYKLQIRLLNGLNKISNNVHVSVNHYSNHLFSALFNLVLFDKYVKFLEKRS
ncbi:MAG: hypothetical protein UV73_C0011G0019 [Candidatus Gottesmanbacteria bacterium GW2011_GWA2_43_14]|uniref:Peptidase S9 prolyl oligopeptidase catalytic domain-containing protein n=1 Tax=Candidatus Gottesmanbacteria bacterium GW2011_GWA2_43_14 TaxID=1618443 RepID=A0A0G1DFH0_9BACT|nr:MAG: hypothetical protein UV73_C0011G0019 [Candidatus Gottesmanbacteria bacterium GW2011_GWA2_43_14]